MNNSSKKWIFAPYAIETAYRYWLAAEELREKHLNIAVVNAALSIEISLKSFNLQVSDKKGQLNECYSFSPKLNGLHGKEAHDLIKLYDLLPEDVKEIIIKKDDLHFITRYKDSFVIDRYLYEKNARKGAASPIIEVAGNIVTRCIGLYKDLGCTDPWILDQNWRPKP